MNRRQCMSILVAGGTLTLLGCSRTEGPEDPVWGKRACAHCAMIVDDKRYAAQLVIDGERSHFDDIGCMIAFIGKRNASPERAWVRDETRDAWLEARNAHYRRGAKTPMDYGFSAGAEGPLSFEDVRREIAERRAKTP